MRLFGTLPNDALLFTHTDHVILERAVLGVQLSSDVSFLVVMTLIYIFCASLHAILGIHLVSISR